MGLVFKKPKDFWLSLPMLTGNAVAYNNLGEGETYLTGTHIHKVSLKEAKKIKGWCKIPVVGAPTSIVRLQFSLDDLVWNTFTGMDISLAAVQSSGIESAIIPVPALAKSQEFVTIRVVCAGGDGVADPQVTFYTPSILVQV